MDKKINERYIKISQGIFPIGDEIKIEDAEYSVAEIVSLDSAEYKNNQDGSVDLIHKMKPTGQFALQDKYKKTTYAEVDKRKQSQKLRAQIMMAEDKLINYMTEKEYYNWYMTRLRHYLPEVTALIGKLEKEAGNS